MGVSRLTGSCATRIDVYKRQALIHARLAVVDLENGCPPMVLDAVTRQLVSDVPVATFLSGGLDSSLISAIADSHFTARGKTLPDG